MTNSNSFNRFSFDIRSVLDDDRRRLLKKYRETKKKAKILFRRQADQGIIHFLSSFLLFFVSFQEIITLLDGFTSSNEYKITLINELIYECRRLYPLFEPRLIQYKMNIVTDSSLSLVREDEPSSSSATNLDDYSMIDM
jgi:hypothetical protein